MPTSPFELNDDGSISQPGNAPAVFDGSVPPVPRLVFQDAAHGLWLYQSDSIALLDAFHRKYGDGGHFDAVFADPPYFLSNGGMTCHTGRMVKVDKGDWDKSRGHDLNHQFTTEWLRCCQRVLKPNGTLWVTGTQHVIFSVGFAMQQLGFKILNVITWEKPNPPPNLSCRYFTHSTETVIWAARSEKSRHFFNYKLMRQTNRGKQMKSVWRIGAHTAAEKAHRKHPTQKPLALVERCLLASTHPGDLVLDPFAGAATTAVAAARLGRRCVGSDLDLSWLDVGSKRLTEAIALLKNQTPQLLDA
jgi:site-specific DNA-methyltransferase (adenine-specific)